MVWRGCDLVLFPRSRRCLLPLSPADILCGTRRHALAIDRRREGTEARGAGYTLAISSSCELQDENSNPDRVAPRTVTRPWKTFSLRMVAFHMRRTPIRA